MRIMKDNHLQKFRIKVLGISDLNAQGGTLFMKNYPIFNMKCNTQTDLHTTGAVDTSNNLFYYTGTGNNDFYLGTLKSKNNFKTKFNNIIRESLENMKENYDDCKLLEVNIINYEIYELFCDLFRLQNINQFNN